VVFVAVSLRRRWRRIGVLSGMTASGLYLCRTCIDLDMAAAESVFERLSRWPGYRRQGVRFVLLPTIRDEVECQPVRWVIPGHQ
jgi:hypothetical protein